jgi:hypothetical protein
MVAYQPDTKLFRQLTIACAAIMDQSPKEQDMTLVQNQKMVADIINTFIGSSMTFIMNDEYPCMRIFDEYHNGALIRNDHREWVAEYSAFVRKFMAAGARRGKVDIAKAKVSGLFAELPWTIYMPQHWFTHKYNPDGFTLSAEEIASIIIHEIGHFFTYCEAFFRTVTTNVILSDQSKALASNYDVAERELIIGRTVADLGLKDVNVKALAASDNQLIETALVYEAIELSRTELGVDIYDTTSSEALADQFVSRMGAARYMVTALNKFHQTPGADYDAYTPMPVFMFLQMLSVAGMFVAGFVNPLAGFLWVGYNVLNIACGGFNDYGDGTYDTPKKRFERVRNDAINRLKNRNIGDAERSRVLDDINTIEKILKDVAERTNWQTWVAQTFIPKYRRARNSMALQQELEALANNPLYVSAAKLASLST